ncbi:HlyD family efflux transporter periplasmic adaptor subunit [Achromobacter sp. ES-001]|uniref:HlyD family efflux transporter periplasmic adaptor subunit n=1 Tax=Achromobacter sp. ES-001 TaxID=2860286 RepID=UPI001C6449F7|nr:HlyD family efflux transporter periplasmic adaptor subunit [Achromobacter sp. ES-001]QYJ21935.1 HlyD family efflux transporter periplasmic adaptor subunit [Achromobacter sp. ES-001]
MDATALLIDDADPEASLDARVLPPLRQDLRLIRDQGGTRAGEWGGNWRIHDPAAHRFFAVDQDTVGMLAQWHQGTVGALRSAVARSTGRAPEDHKILGLIEFLQRHELVAPAAGETYARVRQQRSAQKRSLATRMLHSYLFFKVPLARPDAFLRRTLPLVTPFFSRTFWILALLLGVSGLYLVSRQWEAFLHTFPDMISATGLIAFGLSLAFVKTLHELGHGYTAVRLGSRVTTMGVAFVVMTPILYTDTTDAWRLPRRQRVLIDGAGMAVELLVAVFATLAWVFVPDGPWRNVAFALATTGWVLSLAVNLNPLMRFDGYYLFSDLIGIPGLQDRSFAMARWWMRERLFGYGDEQPEPTYGHTRLLLIGFAYATWIYRFFLFLGIALLVYHYFFKILGIFLFAVEISWFILLPIWREMKVWVKRRHEVGRQAFITLGVLVLLVAVLLVPLPYTVRIPAVLTATEQAPAFAPRPARLEAVRVRQGETVRAGQILMALSASEIEQQLVATRERERLLNERLDRRSADRKDLSETLTLAREVQLERDRATGLERERSRLAVRAPIDGVVVELALELSPGRWVDEKTRLAIIAAPGSLEARGYVNADDLRRIREGDSGEFVDEQRLMPARAVQIARVGAAANDTLENWILTSAHGGDVAARQFEGRLRAEQAVFEVAANVTDASRDDRPLTELRGEMQIKGEPISLASRVVRRVVSVLLREAGA